MVDECGRNRDTRKKDGIVKERKFLMMSLVGEMVGKERRNIRMVV